MKKMFRDMNKVNFESVTAGISLYRPGPLQFLPKYIACANHYSEPEYLFPELEPILKDTFGILIYQEQLMEIARKIAGFDWLNVDGYRKAIGKKIEKKILEMNQWLVYGHNDDDKNIHIPGLIAQGISETKALKLAEELVDFGKYCFNKSHGALYSKVSVGTAYLKSHYPIEFITPLISSFMGKDPEKVVQYINEAKRMEIRLLPPDINASEFEFTIESCAFQSAKRTISPEELYNVITKETSDEVVDNDCIRYGLGAIKGLSKAAIVITDNRAKNGLFTGIDNFLSRFGKKEMNKKALDVLTLTGALDSLARELGEHPMTVVEQVKKETITTKYDLLDVVDNDGNIDRLKLLGVIYKLRSYGSTEGVLEAYCDEENVIKMKKKYAKVSNTSDTMAILSVEHALLGMYVSAHPLTDKAEPIDWQSYTHGMRFDATCIIRNIRMINTRFGKPMAFVSIETLEGMKDIVVFTKEYEAHQGKLEVGGIRIITLESQLKDGAYSYIAKNIKLYRG